MKRILTICKKELKDTIRDRRTLLSMVVLPMVLMPLLTVGMGKLMESQIQKSEEKQVRVAVRGGVYAPELMNLLKNDTTIQLEEVPDGDLTELVRDDQAEAGMEISPDFSDKVAAFEPVTVTVYSDSTDDIYGTVMPRISAALALYNQQVRAERFATAGIDASILTEIQINPVDVSTEQERGGFGLGFLLPLMIVMWATIGGQYTAIDVSAGEKERRTLEALLLTPVKRLHLVLGKFLAVATVSLVSVIISMGSMYFAVVRFGFPGVEDGVVDSGGTASRVSFTIDPEAVALMLGVSLLLVCMFSAVLLSIAIFAKSFKEAQSYISPAYLIIVLPVTLINSIPSFKPSLGFYAIPGVNATLLFKDLLKSIYDPLAISITFISLLVYATVSLLVAARIYEQEGVLLKN